MNFKTLKQSLQHSNSLETWTCISNTNFPMYHVMTLYYYPINTIFVESIGECITELCISEVSRGKMHFISRKKQD